MPEAGIFFLIVVSLALGWGLGWLSRGMAGSIGRDVLEAPYPLGLTHLSSEQPDREVDPLLQALEVSPGSFDTLSALGNLMRRKGAVERAISIHQNLVDNPQLEIRHQHRAYLELARDYQKAGLLDRAESILLDLVDVAAELRLVVLGHLMDLYDEESEWDKAIAIAERWLNVSITVPAFERDNTARRAAYYCCELAVAAQRQARAKAALQYCSRAYSFDRDCFRAGLIEAEIRQQQGAIERAAEALRTALERSPRYLSIALPLLRRLYQEGEGTLALHAYLREYLEHHRSAAAVLTIAGDLERLHSPTQAREFLSQALEQQASLQGVARLIELQLQGHAEVGDISLARLRAQIDQLIASHPAYHCEHCGFSGRAMHWKCLSCRQWGTVLPIVGPLGE